MHEDMTAPDGAGQVVGGPAALVQALTRLLQLRDGSTPLSEPAELIRRLLRLLEAQNIDGESLLRFGMAPMVSGPAFGAVIIRAILDREGAEPASHLDEAGWQTALGVPEIKHDNSIDSHWFHTSTEKLKRWVLTAPLDDLLELKPPSREEVASLPQLTEQDYRLGNVYEWLYSRTVGTPVESWGAAERHLEYRWQDGELESPAPERLMAEAVVDRDRLCRAIAQHAVYSPMDAEEQGWLQLLIRMQEQAKSFLRERRYVEAAALFEYLLGQRPGDARAANNLGFCLIPVDRVRASSSFRAASRAGFPSRSLLLYNQICSAPDDESLADLLHEADRHWVGALELDPPAATIWVHGPEGSWTEAETGDVREDLARAALEAAEALGRFDRAAVWRKRLEELTGSLD